MSRIGIYGGTFDPPHIGHLHAAQAAQAELMLDRVLFIPSNIPPHKALSANSASPQQRFEMVSLAVSSYPWAEVSDIEITAEGKSYTVDTLRKLRLTYPTDEIWMIIGTDMLLTLDKWYCPEIIMQLANIAAVGRNVGDMPALADAEKRLEDRFHATIRIVDCPPLPLSSTEVRHLVGKAALSEVVTPDVCAYIRDNGLYRQA